MEDRRGSRVLLFHNRTGSKLPVARGRSWHGVVSWPSFGCNGNARNAVVVEDFVDFHLVLTDEVVEPLAKLLVAALDGQGDVIGVDQGWIRCIAGNGRELERN